MTTRHNERGLALVVVLWGIAALSLIAAAMLASAMNTAIISRNAWTQLQVQTAADAGIQRAILSLFDPKTSDHLPFDGREQNISIQDAEVTVTIQDEDGRIDINYAGRGLLRDFFKSAGADPAEADALADRAIDWRSPKGTSNLNGASADDYEKAGYAYAPRGGPFQSVDELNLVMGMTPELFRRVAPGLTVNSHMANFDMRTAPKDVLEVIPGMTEGRADETIAARVPAAPAPGHAFVVTAIAERNHMRFSRHATILISGDPAKPYWILDWK